MYVQFVDKTLLLLLIESNLDWEIDQIQNLVLIKFSAYLLLVIQFVDPVL